MDLYRVSLIGHRELDTREHFFVEEQLFSIVEELMRTKEYVEFYVGRNGDFDLLAASVIRRVRQDYGGANSSMILVIPYEVADIEYYEEYYNEVIYPVELYHVHYKAAITKRNEWLVENSDMLVAYVVRDGGAAHCLNKAVEQGLTIRRIYRASVKQY